MKMEMIVLIAGLIALIVFAGTVSAIYVPPTPPPPPEPAPTPIPEFSNIAIPIVTIFGLMLFVYYRSRRK